MALLTRPMPTRQLPMAMPEAPLRRCTFRRVSAVQTGRAGAVYDVACMYPDRTRPMPLGDLDSARPICESCVALGTFRPDSD